MSATLIDRQENTLTIQLRIPLTAPRQVADSPWRRSSRRACNSARTSRSIRPARAATPPRAKNQNLPNA